MKRCTVLVDCCENCPHYGMAAYDCDEPGAVEHTKSEWCGLSGLEFDADFNAKDSIHPLCPLPDADAPQIITTTTGE